MGLLDLLRQGSGGGYGGLLDSLMPASFDERFGAAPAAFADRFNAAPNAPQQFAPGGRQFDQATFDPATYAPNQAQPIGVGGYQMPRMGSADLYAPQQAMIPPNAQPTQGQLPPQMQQQPQQQLPPAFGQPQSEGFGGNALTGLQSFLNGGGLISSIRGAMNGQRADPAGMAQQNLAAQFQAMKQTLIQSGLSDRDASSKAMLALTNADAGKTILNEALTNKEKYGIISEDPLAGKKYGFINEREQTVNGRPVTAQSAASAGGGSMDALQAAQNAGVTGPALYDHMPKAIGPVVRAMVEGRQPLPSTTAMRSPATLALIEAAHAVDPSFDATVWKARNEAGPDWSKGKSSEMVRSANQTLAHVGSLMNAMDALKNRSVPAWNAAGNFVQENLGAGEQGSFRTNAHAVAEEMSKVFKGANLSDSEIRHWEQNLSENMSPTQQRAQIAKLSELLHGSLQALEEKRLSAMGPAAAEKMGPLIKPEGQAVLKRIKDWVDGNSTPATAGSIQEGATATNPQTGAKITFRNGKWQ